MIRIELCLNNLKKQELLLLLVNGSIKFKITNISMDKYILILDNEKEILLIIISNYSDKILSLNCIEE